MFARIHLFLSNPQSLKKGVPMSGTQDENSAAQNSQEFLQQVQAGSEQNIEKSVREAENLRDKELTPAQKMDLLLRGQSPAQLKREIEKLRKEAAKYRTSSKKEEEQKLALQTRAQEIQNELDALKNAHRTLAVIRKLDKAGCIKSELVAKDIPDDLELGDGMDEFIERYKEENEFLFQQNRANNFGGTFKSCTTKVLTPSQQMDAYIRAALGR